MLPEVGSIMSQKPQKKNKKKQHGAKVEPKLDTARKLRGICYVDPDGMEFKNTMMRAKEAGRANGIRNAV